MYETGVNVPAFDRQTEAQETLLDLTMDWS